MCKDHVSASPSKIRSVQEVFKDLLADLTSHDGDKESRTEYIELHGARKVELGALFKASESKRLEVGYSFHESSIDKSTVDDLITKFYKANKALKAS